jgi:hypothetical protein
VARSFRFYDLKIEDLSDSLQFKSLVLKLEYPGDSDQPTSEFVEYINGKLNNLFEILWLESLQRKDANTLTGVVRYTDEIVYMKIDVPITVSLKDNSVTRHPPDIQYIGHYSKTLEPLKVYRVKGKTLSLPYIIKKGTEITIDTFYRKQGIVRMLVADSTSVYIRLDDIGDKIERNTAG